MSRRGNKLGLITQYLKRKSPKKESIRRKICFYENSLSNTKVSPQAPSELTNEDGGSKTSKHFVMPDVSFEKVYDGSSDKTNKTPEKSGNNSKDCKMVVKTEYLLPSPEKRKAKETSTYRQKDEGQDLSDNHLLPSSPKSFSGSTPSKSKHERSRDRASSNTKRKRSSGKPSSSPSPKKRKHGGGDDGTVIKIKCDEDLSFNREDRSSHLKKCSPGKSHVKPKEEQSSPESETISTDTKQYGCEKGADISNNGHICDGFDDSDERVKQKHRKSSSKSKHSVSHASSKSSYRNASKTPEKSEKSHKSDSRTNIKSECLLSSPDKQQVKEATEYFQQLGEDDDDDEWNLDEPNFSSSSSRSSAFSIPVKTKSEQFSVRVSPKDHRKHSSGKSTSTPSPMKRKQDGGNHGSKVDRNCDADLSVTQSSSYLQSNKISKTKSPKVKSSISHIDSSDLGKSHQALICPGFKVKSQKATELINVKKNELNKKGFRDLVHWLQTPRNVYIGRNMEFYVKGATSSKWRNPFSVKKYGRDECLRRYEEHIKSKPELYNSLEELHGKCLGCWCYPEPCHGSVLIKLLNNKLNKS